MSHFRFSVRWCHTSLVVLSLIASGTGMTGCGSSEDVRHRLSYKSGSDIGASLRGGGKAKTAPAAPATQCTAKASDDKVKDDADADADADAADDADEADEQEQSDLDLKAAKVKKDHGTKCTTTTGGTTTGGTTTGGTATGGTPALDGSALYTSLCANCHGAKASTDIRDKSAAGTRSAIQSIGAMKNIQASDAQLTAISQFLLAQ